MAPQEPRPRFSFRRFVQRRLRFLAVAMPLACAVLLLPINGWLFELLRHFRLWNAVIGLAIGALLLLFRDWKFAAVALAAGVWQGWPVWSYSRGDGRSTVSVPPGESFTLLTCNLLYECREPERMIASLREANPDVLLLLEYTPEWEKKFAESLWKDYPNRVERPAPSYSGICLASKIPFGDRNVMEGGEGPGASASTCVRGVIIVGEHRVTILGVHPPPPMRPELFATWRASFAQWPKLLGEAGLFHGVVAGDLNCTPFANTFTDFCERTGMRDSARGFELTNTWHLGGTFLGLPLDHILVGKAILVTERTIGPAAGSDHHWVMARLVPINL